jgi:hypothetical protein
MPLGRIKSGHYSPESIYAEVRRETPSISLATVYNNLRLFVEHGLDPAGRATDKGKDSCDNSASC